MITPEQRVIELLVAAGLVSEDKIAQAYKIIGSFTTHTEPEDECNWTQEDWDSDMWSGSCGACWSLNDGTPEENDMKYCTNCGKRLVQHIWQQEDK